MNLKRKMVIVSIIGLLISTGAITSIARTNLNSPRVSSLDGYITITSPDDNDICSGDVYISWIVDIVSPWAMRCEVYCGNHLDYVGVASSGSFYWDSETVSNGECIIVARITADQDLDGIFETVLASDAVQIYVQNSNEHPEACFTCSNINPDINQTVYFDGSCSVDPDGYIKDYYWFYTDEGTGSPVEMGYGKTFSYIWNDSGVYFVTLEVTDNDNNKDQMTRSLTVGGESDLTCTGILSWTRVTAGELVTGNFTISNTGEPGSRLYWKILSYPDWGEWTITPDEGTQLPAGEHQTVNVFVEAPNIKESSFSGEILVMNEDNSSDFEKISVSLATPQNKEINQMRFDILRIVGKQYTSILLFLTDSLGFNGGKSV